MLATRMRQATSGASGAVLTSTYQSTAVSTSDTTSYSFSSLGIGTATSDRHVMAVLFSGGSSAGAALPLSNVTIGGSAATELIAFDTTTPSAAASMCAIYYRKVTTGTTATIAFDVSTTARAAGVAVYTITGADGISLHDSLDVSIGAASLMSGTIDTVSGGVLIGGVEQRGLNRTMTWVGIDDPPDIETFMQTGQEQYSATKENVTSTDTGRTVSCTLSGNGTQSQMSVASIVAA